LSTFPFSYTSTSTFTLFISTYTSPTHIYTLSLHDALPILNVALHFAPERAVADIGAVDVLDHGDARTEAGADIFVIGNAALGLRSEEHTSELQSHLNLVCRLLLEKKKNYTLIMLHTRVQYI